MDIPEPGDRVVHASRTVAAPAQTIFDLVADPTQQPRWDGNDNLASASPGQRVTSAGQVFTTVLTGDGVVRENHVEEFVEGRLISWRPAEPGKEPAGHLWRWELEPLDEASTRVTHTYDWTSLQDPKRLERARRTTPDRLLASVDRLASLAEAEAEATGRKGDA